MKVECFSGYKAVTVYGIKFRGRMIYIGITTASVNQRVYKHFSQARKPQARDACPKLYAHIRANPDLSQYSISVLDQCTREEAEGYEQKYIARYDTLENGFNKTKGGNWAKGSDHYLYGKHVAAHIVEASVRARLGKRLSEEHKEKLRRAHLGRKDQSKPIRCLDTDEIFPSIAETARAHNISKTSLLRHLSGCNKSCGGRRYERT
jgi:hypothetical protein